MSASSHTGSEAGPLPERAPSAPDAAPAHPAPSLSTGALRTAVAGSVVGKSIELVTLVLLAVLSAVAVAAIPGGALPMVAGLLAAFGIPPEGIGIILGVERLLDMTRTMVNVGSDVVTTIVVDHFTKLEHEPGAAGSHA